MATRMQQRRGTAAQWISTNNGDGPILEVGEIGFETDTGKFKIGDGVNPWVDLDYFLDESEITSITGDYVLSSTLAQNNGVATLDNSGKLTSSQIPTSLASTTYVDNAVSGLVDSAPGLLNTLNELAAAVNDDPTFFTTVATNLSNHESDTTNVHGIANTADLATKTYADNAAGAAQTAAELTASGALSTHASDTTSVHGITDTAELATKTFAAELLTNATKTNITITGDKNGLTITAENGVGDSTTDNLTEGTTNKYFTNQRALDATASAYDASGAASTAQTNAQNYADTAVSNHSSDTTNVHGITDTSALVITSGAQTLSDKTLTSPIINGATIGGNLVPSANATYDLGSSANKFKDLYLSGTTLYLDAATIGLHSGNIQFSHSGNTTIVPIGGGEHTVATQSYVDTAVSNLVDTAPSTLNTLNELAAAINDDASYASTVTTALGNKLDSSTAASTYAPITSPTFTGTVGGITKSMVGLGNVDNTTDLLKPISTATQTALDLKANLASPTFTGTVTLPAGTSGANLVNIPNSALTNSSITINGSAVSLGGSTTIDVLPSQTSNSGKYLTTNGTSASWATISFPFVPMPATSVSSDINLVSNNEYFVNTSVARTLTLPASPALGDEIYIFDSTGSAATNNITLNNNGNKINGVLDTLQIDIAYDAVSLIYTGSDYGWKVI